MSSRRPIALPLSAYKFCETCVHCKNLSKGRVVNPCIVVAMGSTWFVPSRYYSHLLATYLPTGTDFEFWTTKLKAAQIRVINSTAELTLMQLQALFQFFFEKQQKNKKKLNLKLKKEAITGSANFWPSKSFFFQKELLDFGKTWKYESTKHRFKISLFFVFFCTVFADV